MSSASLVAHVFRSNWLSFYEWKAHDAIESLVSLLAPEQEEDTDWSDISSDEEEDTLLISEADHITVSEYSSSSKIITVLPAIKNTIQFILEPHPSYTSTTPLRRSILVGDDLNPMPFIPFSDDPSFPHESHMDEHYETFAWHEVDFFDPDCE